MSATLIGTTIGVWGAVAETGIIVASRDEDYQTSEAPLKNNEGCTVGTSIYDERVEINISGSVDAGTAYADAVGDSLTLTGAVTYANLQAASGGTTVLKSVQRSRQNEQFQGITISATLYPLVV